MNRTARLLWSLFFPVLCLPLLAVSDEPADQKKDDKLPVITESIQVEGKAPRELPFSSTTTFDVPKLEATHARDLAEVLSYVPGTFVSVGNKNEWGVKIRGLDPSRTTLLFDGIPVYEPYYNSYDLKTFTADDIDSIQVVKGASSVLYGPNALGGIVDVLSRRPSPPQLSLKAGYGENKTWSLGGRGALGLGRRASVLVGANHEASDGYDYRQNDVSTPRFNSDYHRTNLLGKIYLYPGNSSEILAEVNYFTTEYGVPPSTATSKPNYWRFKDWYRLSFNLGGTTPIFGSGQLKARFYYMKYYNVLDAYKTAAMNTLQWESTYDNHSMGAFVLGNTPLSERHELQFSATLRADRVKTQSALGKPWLETEQNTLSIGVEDRISLGDRLGVNVGASVDFLDKEAGMGDDKTRINPILGLMFQPILDLDLRLTLAQKSRFPSMRNLYSATAGNPDLRDERGTNLELGFTWRRGLRIDGAAFINRVSDMIDKFNLPDGTFIYKNTKEARISGFEVEAQKQVGIFSLGAAYTYLNARNHTENRPLDIVPKSQVSLFVTVAPPRLARLTLWGYAVTQSFYFTGGKEVPVPGYTLINLSLERTFGPVVVHVKADNLLDGEYATEPGFPMRGRTLSAGFRLGFGGDQPRSR